MLEYSMYTGVFYVYWSVVCTLEYCMYTGVLHVYWSIVYLLSIVCVLSIICILEYCSIACMLQEGIPQRHSNIKRTERKEKGRDKSSVPPVESAAAVCTS
ncbi:unnamed protein product [Discosporangium mesarthrocarpum]